MKPILFLDVDGVLNVRLMPFHEYLVEVATAEMAKNAFTNSFSGDTVTLTVRVPTYYYAWLAELAQHFELVWATTWEHLANKHLSPIFDLPPLPVLELSAHPPNS